MRNREKGISGLGGVNLNDDPSGIDDSELIRAANVWPRLATPMAKRPSMVMHDKLLGPNRLASLTMQSIKGFIFPALEGVEDECFFVYTKDDIDYGLLLGSKYSFGAAIALWPSGPAPFLLNVGARTLVLGSEPRILRRNPGTGSGYSAQLTTYQLLGTGNADVKPKLAAVHGNGRVILANLAPGYEHACIWSSTPDIEDPLFSFGDSVLAANGRWIAVGNAAEGPLTAIHYGSNAPQEYPLQAAVFFWKENAMYTMLGEPGIPSDADPRGTATLVRNNLRAGCVSQNTVVTTPYGLFWAGPDDVWFMPHGNQPIRVGTKIRKVLEGQPLSARWRWHAVYEDGAYKLALFGEGQGPSELEGCEAHWWLDLRNGPPSNFREARWYGPHKFIPSNCPAGTFAMRQDTRPNSNGKNVALHFGVLPSVTGGGGGPPWGPSGGGGASSNDDAFFMTFVTLTGNQPRDTALPQGFTSASEAWAASTVYSQGAVIYPKSLDISLRHFYVSVAGTSDVAEPDFNTLGGGIFTDNTVEWKTFATPTGFDTPTYEAPSNQNGNEILIDVVSKDCVDPSPSAEKLLTEVYGTVQLSNDTLFDYQFVADRDESFGAAQELTEAVRRTGADQLSWPQIERKWQGLSFTPNSGQRSRAHSFQFRLTEKAGFVLPEAFTSFSFFDPVDGTSLRTGTLAVGDHGSLTDFMNNLYGLIGGWATVPVAFTANGAYVTFANTVESSDFGVPYGNAAFGTFPSNTLTEAQLVSNRFIMSLLGYGTADGPGLFVGNGQTSYGDTQPFHKQASDVVLVGLTMRYRPFRRMP